MPQADFQSFTSLPLTPSLSPSYIFDFAVPLRSSTPSYGYALSPLLSPPLPLPYAGPCLPGARGVARTQTDFQSSLNGGLPAIVTYSNTGLVGGSGASSSLPPHLFRYSSSSSQFPHLVETRRPRRLRRIENCSSSHSRRNRTDRGSISRSSRPGGDTTAALPSTSPPPPPFLFRLFSSLAGCLGGRD